MTEPGPAIIRELYRANKSSCAKSKRAVVIFDPQTLRILSLIHI